MEEYRKRFETLLLDTEDFELIAKLAKLLPVIRMAEQVRAMTADLKADTTFIAAGRIGRYGIKGGSVTDARINRRDGHLTLTTLITATMNGAVTNSPAIA